MKFNQVANVIESQDCLEDRDSKRQKVPPATGAVVKRPNLWNPCHLICVIDFCMWQRFQLNFQLSSGASWKQFNRWSCAEMEWTFFNFAVWPQTYVLLTSRTGWRGAQPFVSCLMPWSHDWPSCRITCTVHQPCKLHLTDCFRIHLTSLRVLAECLWALCERPCCQ